MITLNGPAIGAEPVPPDLRALYPVAAYVRTCHLLPRTVASYREEVRVRAERVGIPPPVFFEDAPCEPGLRHPEPLHPGLACLLDLVAADVFRAVLVPGSFVFAPTRPEADAIVERITAHGCSVIPLP